MFYIRTYKNENALISRYRSVNYLPQHNSVEQIMPKCRFVHAVDLILVASQYVGSDRQ